MNLNDYQWSMNPRGMHNRGATFGINIDRLSSLHLGWMKLVCSDREYLNQIPHLLAAGMTPIVRLWRPRFGVGAIAPDMIAAWQAYIGAGVRWFEFYNEPNQDIEWPMGEGFSYNDTAGTIGPLMTTWLSWAELIVSLGGYPAFPALADAATADQGTAAWLDAMLVFLRDNYLDRVRTLIDNGLWCAVHSVPFNHYYQESGDPRVPRPPELEVGTEGGWHFEYPYDPVCQSDDPGRTFYGGTALSKYGDPNGLIATGDAFIKRLNTWFGGNIVPVVSTEGGIEPLPSGAPVQPDPRYPPYNLPSHGEATVAMFNWIAQTAPPWMFGLCLWKEDGYFDGPLGYLPAVLRMQQIPPISKPVPALPTLGDRPEDWDAVIRPGPGPVHGTPDYHYIYLDPNVNPEWYLAGSQEFWSKYHPTLISHLDVISFIPHEKSLSLMVITTPDTVDAQMLAIKHRWRHVVVDPVIVEKADDVAQILKGRIAADNPYGIK
ncbi:MAG TPA: hypothetical protein VMT34_09645 [Aggregatilineales bacterium]|nr:hypothetical protein [Aggregatilineales bacterium]